MLEEKKQKPHKKNEKNCRDNERHTTGPYWTIAVIYQEVKYIKVIRND